MKPAEPTPDRVGNVVWRGIRLRDVLARAGYDPRASYVQTDGYDSGSFEGVVAAEYQKDLPIAKALQDDVMLVFEINGAPLSAHRGGPVRLVVPGWYGTNSVKWLRTLHLADRRADGPFTTVWYNDTDASGISHPVWSAAPDSAIVRPAAGEKIDAGALTVIGWSWGEQDIAHVDLSTDGGASWAPSILSPRTDKSWQGFSAQLRIDGSGPVRIISRATDVRGRFSHVRRAQCQRRGRGACLTLADDLRYSSGLLESNSLPRMISLPNLPAGGEAPFSRMILDASVATITCSASFL